MTANSTSQLPHSFHTIYDGDGRRVKKQVGNEVTIFVYDGGGALVAEYTINAPASTTTPQTIYLTADVLGSPRINTNQKGEVVARHDYLPFGDEIIGLGQRTPEQGYGMPDGVRKKFTGYEKDQETGLDFAQARYYGNGLGRFTSVDPTMKSARPTIPQSWNRYAYVLNNPLNLIDPTGLCPEGRECFKDESGEYFIDNGERIYVVYARLFSPPSIREILGGTVTTLPRPTTTTAPKPPFIWTPPSLPPTQPQTPPATPATPVRTGWTLNLFRASVFLSVFKAFETSTGCGSMPNGISDGNGGCTKKADPKPDVATTKTNGPATTQTPDRRDPLLVYHGTDANSANDIMKNGLNVRRAMDFGGGDIFWTTTNLAHAQLYAEANPAGGVPAILQLTIPRESADSLIRQGTLVIEGTTYKFLRPSWSQVNATGAFVRIK